MAASTKLFASLGFDGVTMRQIAEAANITLPSIYHHFGNKEDLYKAVEADMYNAHAARLIDAMVSTDNPEDNLRKFMKTLLGHLHSNPDYLKLLQRGLIEDWEDNQNFLVEMSMQGVFDKLKDLLETFSARSGEGPSPIAIFSLVIGFLTMRPVTEKLKNYSFASLSREEQHNQIVEMAIDLVKSQIMERS